MKISVALLVPLTWMLGLVAAAAACHALRGLVMVALIVVVPVVIIVRRTTCGVEPRWFALAAGTGWFVVAA